MTGFFGREVRRVAQRHRTANDISCESVYRRWEVSIGGGSVMAEILEALMLFFFSISWYWSIAKMITTQQAAGKSYFFVVLICTGYIFGIGSKFYLWSETGVLSAVTYLYVWNLIVTAVDLVLVLHFTKKGAAEAATSPGALGKGGAAAQLNATRRRKPPAAPAKPPPYFGRIRPFASRRSTQVHAQRGDRLANW